MFLFFKLSLKNQLDFKVQEVEDPVRTEGAHELKASSAASDFVSMGPL